MSTALSKLSDVLCQSSQQLGPCLEVVTLAAPGLQPLQLQVKKQVEGCVAMAIAYMHVMVMLVAIVM